MPQAVRIEAAGGVLWRAVPGAAEVEVALVHRPKYDDWSLPKGKLDDGEHPLVGAVREVEEETGFVGAPGRPLGEIRYLKDGQPKRVRYWAMAATSGSFVPNEEVDQIRWLPAKDGQRLLLPDRDRHILTTFTGDPRPTWPLLLVRHGSAGERSEWSGADDERPLDDIGRAQADALTRLFDLYRVTRVVSADVLRCLETVQPYATLRSVAVDSEPLVSESGFETHPDRAVERMLTLLGEHQPVVVCSQGRTIPVLLTGLCSRLDAPPPVDTTTRKGGFWVLHVAAKGKARLAASERFEPLA